MTDIIKMEYDLMEEMSRTFLQGVEQLQDTGQDMQSVANMLQDGALLGRGGDAFTEAIRGKLCPAIARLADKFQELSGDILTAMREMQEADQEAKSNF